jgi:protein-disulfide isomerase
MTTETKSIIIAGIICVAILFGGAWLYQRNAPSVAPSILTENQDALVRADSMKISASASSTKVTVVEFGDYQCPACAYIEPALDKLKADYKDRVTFVFRDFPLSMHKNAIKAAQMTYIANEQGKYWEMHGKIYGSQKEWETLPDPSDVFVSYAAALGMNTAGIKEKLSSNIYQDRINKDIADGGLVGVDSTPTFFINNTIIRRADYEVIKAAIEEELAK